MGESASKAIGAGTAIAGGIGQGIFGNKAAKQNANAQGETYGVSRGLVNEAAGRLDPYYDTGNQALSPLTGLILGKSYDPQTGQFGAPLSQEDRMKLFQTSPGYQFRLDQAQKAIENSQAARGNVLSGGALKELSRYNQALSSDEYNNYLGQLFKLSGMGQQAATSQAGIQGSSIPGLSQLYLGSQLGSAQQNQNISNIIGSVGAQLSSLAGQQNTSGGGMETAGISAGSTGSGYTGNSNMFQSLWG